MSIFTQLTHTEPEHIQLLEVVGRIDGNNALCLISAFDQAMNLGRKQIVLDLSGCEYMNSAGLRELVHMYERVRQTGGALYITNPTERVKNLLEIVGLDTVIEIRIDPAFNLAHVANNGLSALNRQVCYCV